jgi:hypothetical protein
MGSEKWSSLKSEQPSGFPSLRRAQNTLSTGERARVRIVWGPTLVSAIAGPPWLGPLLAKGVGTA